MFFGGPLGDRFGRKYVIWFSILGALPFALIMPHAGLTGGAIAAALAGFVMSSATAAIIVFAILGKITDWLIQLIAAPFLRWQDSFSTQAGGV